LAFLLDFERPATLPQLAFRDPAVPAETPMRGLARDLLDLCLPPRCAGCRRRVPGDSVLCRACERDVPRIAARACALCQEATAAAPGELCRPCEAAPFPLAACCAEAWFEAGAAEWVKRWKYAARGLRGLDPAAEAVARALLRGALPRVPGPPPGAIVPVPLHPARIRARGFSPAAALAAQASRAVGAPLAARLLERVRDTPSQTGLDARARRRNVAGSFALARRARVPETVWLVDDVVTTGATLGEAARVLRAAGAHRVAAVCLARTPAPPR
jgi:ComF family protein